MTQHVRKFFAELQRRKVLRIAAGYVVGAWIVLQVALALQTAMSLSGQFSAAILALLVIGFFVTLVLAWFYEITPEGVKRTAPATGDTPLVKPQTTDLALAGALALVVIVALVQLFTSSPTAPPATAPTTTAETTPAKPEPPALGDKSIAVLPFANLSPDKENEYFADGLTEELLNLLAKIGDLKVISRTSSFAFKGKDTPLPEIAKQLGVRHILEGSVRTSGADLRVTAQLVDVTTDTRLWSETYDRKVEDVFALQDEIASEIASAFHIEVSVSAVSRQPPTTNMEAYRLYLQAKRVVGLTKANQLKRIELAEKAIELDENFAEAHAQLARLYSFMRAFDRAHLSELTDKSRQAAQKALKLNSESGPALAALAALAISELDWEAAVPTAARAVKLAPSDSYPLTVAAIAQVCLGMFENARRFVADKERIDPIEASFDPPLMLIIDGDDGGLREWATKRLTRESWSFRAKLILAIIAREQGAKAEAEKFFRSHMLSFPQNRAITEPVVLALRNPSQRGRAVKALDGEAMRDQAFDLEGVLFLVGDTSAALDAVRRRLLRKQESPSVMAYNFAFVWRLVERGEGDDPNVRSFMRDTGLVDYWKKHGWPDRCRPKGEDDFECS